MLHKTRGIAISYIKYKESSIIARIFTEAFGMQSYIVNSVRSSSAKSKIALGQKLTILDLVGYHNTKKEINRSSENKCSFTFRTIPYQIRKSSIAMFLTELLYQVLREEGENEQLFEFVHESVVLFDRIQENYENFHLHFMLSLSRFLGIRPESAKAMMEEVGHRRKFDGIFVEQLNFMLQSKYGQEQKLTKATRNEILALILDYYRFHYDSIRDLKSIQVLKEVLG